MQSDPQAERRLSSLQPQPASKSAAVKSQISSSNLVGTHYKICRKIGEGSFGIIYEGINLVNNAPIAVKFEPRKCDAPQLRDEYKTYRIMQGTTGVPTVYYFGQEGLHNILCIDLLGPSMEDLFDLCHRKFTVKTTCMAAKQMVSFLIQITRVQAIHEHNLIYRDIKPDNFLVGRMPRHNEQGFTVAPGAVANHSLLNAHPASQIYIVDFGMAKQYRDPKTKVHIPYREKKSLSGTARYMSINTHLGREQSRRDDLEALGHVFMYFLRGSLPWQGLKAATNKQKYEKIGEKKNTTPIKELCKGFPDEFAQYMVYVRELKFEEQPDYDFLRGLFQKVLDQIGEKDDGVFDWMIVLDQQRKERDEQRKLRAQQGKQEITSQVDTTISSPTTPIKLNAPLLEPTISSMQNMAKQSANRPHKNNAERHERERLNSERHKSHRLHHEQSPDKERDRYTSQSHTSTPVPENPWKQSVATPHNMNARNQKPKKWYQKLFSICNSRVD